MPLRTDANSPSGGDARSRALSRINGSGGVAGGSYGPFAPTAATEDPPLYMGSRARGEVEPRGLGTMPATTRSLGQADDVRTQSQALDQFYKWIGTPKMDQWGDHLVNVGLIEEKDSRDYATLSKFWQAAVEESVNAYRADKGKKIDPWKMAEFMGSLGAGASGGSGGSGSGGRAGTYTSTQKSVDLTDPTTARAMVNDVLTAQLGRRATDEEVAAFTSVLSQAERANPVLSSTTTTQDETGNSTSSTSTSGGLSGPGKQEVLVQEAMKKPEWGAYQAATTYSNWFLDALGATAGT
jgi:hypothetical protein